MLAIPNPKNKPLEIEDLGFHAASRSLDLELLVRLQKRLVEDGKKLRRKLREAKKDYASGQQLMAENPPAGAFKCREAQKDIDALEKQLRKTYLLRTRVALAASDCRLERDYRERYGTTDYAHNRKCITMDNVRRLLRTEGAKISPGDHVVVLLPEGLRMGTFLEATPTKTKKVVDFLVKFGDSPAIHVPHFLVALFRRHIDHPDREADSKRYEETLQAWNAFSNTRWAGEYKRRRSRA